MMFVPLKETRRKGDLVTLRFTIRKPVGGKTFRLNYLQNILARCFDSQRLRYSKGPDCNVYHEVLDCTQNLDWLECEDCSVRY